MLIETTMDTTTTTANCCLANEVANVPLPPPCVQSLLCAIEQLKQVFDSKGKAEVNRVDAYEKLAEISKIMRSIFDRLPATKSKDMFRNASNLVNAVKVYNYDNYSSEAHYQVIDAINKVYSSFLSSLSGFVIAEMESTSTSLKASSSSASGADLSPTRSTSHEHQYNVQRQQQQQQQQQQLEDRMWLHPDGLEIVLNQAKISSKYIKDIIYYIEKRTQYDIEYNRSIIKNSQSFRNILNDESCLPFQNVYFEFTTKEIENATTSLKNFNHLIQHFIAPLNEYRAEFDKQIKKIKDTWTRETKKLQETHNNVTKYKDILESRRQELDKIRLAMKSSDHYSEWIISEKIEKKKKAEDDAIARERETRDTFAKAVRELNNQKQSVNNLKRELVVKVHDNLQILETRIKEISFHYFESLKNSMTYSPTQIDKIIEDIQRLANGQAYQSFFNSKLDQRRAIKLKKPHYLSMGYLYEPIDSSESDNNSPSHMYKYQPAHRMFHHESNAEIDMMMRDTQAFNDYDLDSLDCRHTKNRLFAMPLNSFPGCEAPNIVKQCIQEIETRGAQINGIYRVSGVKSKIESLCQSLEENRPITWSNESPNVIANVLKHFFRELPEPLLTFQLYPDFIRLAQKYPSGVDCEEDIIKSLKLIVSLLPKIHYNTLKCLMAHLHRVSLNSAINNMPPSNLGIVFGPNLLKRSNEVNASASTLFDTTHQSRAIELLIMFAEQVFDLNKTDDDNRQEDNVSGDTISLSSCQTVPNIYKDEMTPKMSSTNVKTLPENNFRILKSATCSSIMSSAAGAQTRANSSKQSIVEARRQFFNACGGNLFDKSGGTKNYLNYLAVQADSNESKTAELSPFSQIAVASSSTRGKVFGQSQSKTKRLINFHHHSIGEQPQQPTASDKMYSKNNEMSKSSSSLYSFLKPDFSVAHNNNEDMV